MDGNYENIIGELSRVVSEAFLKEEKDLKRRALLLDGDIAAITRRIGSDAVKIIYERMAEEEVNKKKRTDSGFTRNL